MVVLCPYAQLVEMDALASQMVVAAFHARKDREKQISKQTKQLDEMVTIDG